MRVLLRHILWSAIAGPFVGAMAMLGTILLALPFAHAGTDKVLPGIESLPAMAVFMAAVAYSFGLLPCLLFGVANGLAARRLSPPMLQLSAIAAGALIAIGFALIASEARLSSPYQLVFWAIAGATASLASLTLASRRQ